MTETTKKPLTYAEAGVDIDAGDQLVGMIQGMMQKTHGPRVLGEHGGFAGMFRLDVNEKLFQRNYKEPVLVACTDGVGTKVKLACELKVYNTVGIDCVAMNVNDMIVQRAEPLFFLDYLGLHKQVPETTAKIVEGVAKGCKESGCALIGGECAEMPDIYQEGDFDIAGFAVGVVDLKNTTNLATVEPGDIVIGLHSSGLHSNGFTLARAIVSNLNLNEVYPELHPKNTLGHVLLEPTRIYVKPILGLLGQKQFKKAISGMAHITGGGVAGNLCRSINNQVDAWINVDNINVPSVFNFLQKTGNIESEEMFKVFNMGIGFVLIVPEDSADKAVEKLCQSGEKAYIIGKVTQDSDHFVQII